MLDEDHGVVAADRRLEESLGVGGSRRQHDGQARKMSEECLGTVRMGRAQVSGDPRVAPEHDRHRELAAAHVAHVGGIVHELVEGDVAEAVGHELDDRAQSDHRRADADPGEAVLGNRRVDDATAPELVEHSLRDFVRAVVLGDLLTHEEDSVIALHLLGHRRPKGLAIGQDGHDFALTPGG